jgi:hypothetical protein
MDALLSNVPVYSLERASVYPEVLFAGQKFWRLILPDVTIGLRNEAGEIIHFKMGLITVLQPTRKIPPDEIKGVESVLGTDFLRMNALRLIVDPPRNEAFLEKV